LSFHGGRAIWGGSRVELVEPHGDWAQGTRGVNRGQRQDGETLVELDDGRRVRLPLTKLRRVDLRLLTADDISAWFPYNPEVEVGRRIRRIRRTRVNGYLYELHGHSRRWFVSRAYIDGAALESQFYRTRIFPNQRLAVEAFDHFVAIAYDA
jgi:hypothetical protein